MRLESKTFAYQQYGVFFSKMWCYVWDGEYGDGNSQSHDREGGFRNLTPFTQNFFESRAHFEVSTWIFS